MNPDVPPGSAPVSAEASGEAKPPNRKGLFIALGALAVLAVIAGIAVALVVFVFNGAKNEVEVRVTPTEQNGAATTTSTSTAEASGPADPVANDEVFTFRDIFDPLAGEIAVETATTATDTTTTVDTSEYAADTLYLLNILTDGTTQWALMVWDQKEIQLAEGDVISGTPWKVLDIRTDDVVMLYGDQQVVLSVGQGITK